MNGRLNDEQVSVLLKPINPKRVMQAQGQSHVPAYDVAAHLTRILGFGGWDKEILTLSLINEEPATTRQGKPAWTVTYSCTLRLTIRDQDGDVVARWEDGSCGSSLQPDKGEAHDMAMKSAISYALKRCAAFGLGDQFGLSLYNKGYEGILIGKTLVKGAGADLAPLENVDLESHVPKPESLGNDERQDTEPLDLAGGSFHIHPGGLLSGDGTVVAPGSVESNETYVASDSSKKKEAAPVLGALTPLHEDIKAHPKYKEMASDAKGLFLTNSVGYQVTSIRQLTDADCERVLAALRAL